MGEVFLTINGQQHDLWRAVNQDGNILDVLVQRRHDTTAAGKLSRMLGNRSRDVPHGLVTDRLNSDGASKRERLSGIEHR
jgi:putative transposase